MSIWFKFAFTKITLLMQYAFAFAIDFIRKSNLLNKIMNCATGSSDTSLEGAFIVYSAV